MACFVVPMVEAVIVSIAKNRMKEKEKKAFLDPITSMEGDRLSSIDSSSHQVKKISWSQKLGWLNTLLWGGVFLLALEHIWHGEVVLWPPFLTALQNPNDILPMLHEMAVIGIPMAIFVTLVWGIFIFIVEHKRNCLFTEVDMKE